MEKMKSKLEEERICPVDLQDEDIIRFLKRYHYEMDKVSFIRDISAKMTQVSQICLYRAPSKQGDEVYMLLTLGASVDQLIEAYEAKSQLSEAYACSCLADFILEQIYPRIRREYASVSYADFSTGKQAQEFFSYFQDINIELHSNAMMKPSKTVALIASGTRKPEAFTVHDCDKCPNTTCDRRKVVHSYGYERIFSKGREKI